MAVPAIGLMASTRERLHARYFKLVMQLGGIHESVGDWKAASQVYEHALELDPIAEVLYHKLIVALQKQNLVSEAANVYDRFESQLRASGKAPRAGTNE